VGSWCRFPEAFDAALAQESDLTAAQRADVATAFGELAPHPDVEPALRRLIEAGVRVVTLSHGSPGVAEAGLARGGITPLVERSLSSEAIRAWKPSREAYLWAAGTCDVAPGRMALVAAHGWDVLGAQRAGLTGAWFPRSERTYPAAYEPPHVQAADLRGAVEALLALPE
jgi:2-haloacid dehalogenase